MKTRVVLILAPVMLVLVMTGYASAAAQSAPDIRFVLQTEAGLTAYTNLESTISLPNARQLLATIDIESDSYVYGDYILAGRTDGVKLLITADGWIVAFHPPDYDSQKLMDCYGGVSFSGPEKAVMEAATAIGISDPVIGFYDNRFPEASAITLHWLYVRNSGSDASTIMLPLENIYLERGYVFCTALANSNFWLNGQLIDRAGAVSQVIRRWGPLDHSQLRAGQTNGLEIEAFSFFGTGFFGGVSMVYEGEGEVTAVGGTTRTLNLVYPFGEPLIISKMHLPAVFN